MWGGCKLHHSTPTARHLLHHAQLHGWGEGGHDVLHLLLGQRQVRYPRDQADIRGVEGLQKCLAWGKGCRGGGFVVWRAVDQGPVQIASDPLRTFQHTSDVQVLGVVEWGWECGEREGRESAGGGETWKQRAPITAGRTEAWSPKINSNKAHTHTKTLVPHRIKLADVNEGRQGRQVLAGGGGRHPGEVPGARGAGGQQGHGRLRLLHWGRVLRVPNARGAHHLATICRRAGRGDLHS